MAAGVARAIVVAGVTAAVVAGVIHWSSPAYIPDLKLVSVEPARLKDVPALQPAGEATPDTPVFKVSFSTTRDIRGFANAWDAYTVGNMVFVGDACNPALKTITYAEVAFMLIDFARVYDETGPVEDGAARSSPSSNVYHFYFGVVPSRLQEFAASGAREAPICFTLMGRSATGVQLSTNTVLLPADVLAEAAARLGNS